MNGWIDFRFNINIYLRILVYSKTNDIKKECEKSMFVSLDQIMQYTINPPDVRAVNVKRPFNFQFMQYLLRLAIEEFCIPIKLNSQSTQDGRFWGLNVQNKSINWRNRFRTFYILN